MNSNNIIRDIMADYGLVKGNLSGNRINFPQNLFGSGVYVMFSEIYETVTKDGYKVRAVVGKNSYRSLKGDSTIYIGFKLYLPTHREHFTCKITDESKHSVESAIRKVVSEIAKRCDDYGKE